VDGRAAEADDGSDKEATMRRPTAVLAVLAAAILLLAVPTTAPAQGTISSLSVSPDSVRDGASSTGTVTLAFTDPADTVAKLFSSDPSIAQVPATVVIPAGAQSASFTITTNAAAPPTIVQLTASIQNTPRMANLSVNPATPGGPQLSAVSLNPSTVTGGSSTTGRVTFSGVMTNGAVVQLASSNTALARVPSDVVVNGGQSSAAFAVSTSSVSTQTNVTITARWFSITRTTTLTLTPGAPAPADTVRITKARWCKGLLEIEATSTNPQAILSVFSRAGNFMFQLTNNGGGRYSDRRGFVDNPQQISVRSNLGGSATASTPC
jgi:hypothetical protein